MGDSIFETIAAFESEQAAPWGSVLDAGTGKHSLGWISSTPCERWTAVTASASMAEAASAGLELRAADRLVVGNWSDPELLAGERFDLVLADYLLGALDAFAPFAQDQLFPRLRAHVAGRLYVVGLEPSPARATSPWGELILEVERLRDACIRLAGQRCYREYPRAWVVRNLERAGFRVLAEHRFPIRYGARHVERQLDVGLSKLGSLSDPALARALRAAAEALRSRAQGLAPSAFGEDYLVVATPAAS